MTPYYEDSSCVIYHGDCREVLASLDLQADLVLTDPPYSSGGLTRSDRNQKTTAKYQLTSNVSYHPEFSGDNRDQRSFLLWCDLWMRDCLAKSKAGTVLISFTDWRQLPTMVDAVQVAGWVYRGINVWDKTESARPQKGWFRAQAEYMVLASAGPLDADPTGQCAPGVFRQRVVPNEKLHMTAKPVSLLSSIIQTSPKFQLVVDPFMGSGTTLRAAKDLGRRAIGIEAEECFCEIAARSLEQEQLGLGV